MRKKISNFRLGKLFYNDKFVMGFSIFLAFIFWLYVSSTTQEASVFTVTDIPVSLPELTHELKYFNAQDIKAEVRISGNALVVATVTSDDIYITANDTSFITSPGNYTLDLVPKKSGMKMDYTFDSSPSPSSVNVYVDRQAEPREIEITDKIKVSSVDENSYASTTTLSQQTVKVSGAESIVNSIAQVCAEYEFKSTLSQTTVVTAPLVFYDSLGNKVDTKYITYDIAKVDATIPILKLVNVDIVPSITNMPDTLNISDKITVDPPTIRLAVPTNMSSNAGISTENIDFSKVTIDNNKFEVGLSIPSGCKNINGTEKATITFDTSDMETKTLAVTNFNVINEGDDQTTSVSTQSLNVTLIGSKDQLSTITSSNITAVIDMSAKAPNFIGMAEMPVSIKINSKFNSCWAYGSYTVNVTSSRKSETSQS